jgi:hypothetical protein
VHHTPAAHAEEVPVITVLETDQDAPPGTGRQAPAGLVDGYALQMNSYELGTDTPLVQGWS